MKILIDSVTVGSPGGFQLQRELAWAAVRTMPPQCEVTLLIAEGGADVEEKSGLKVLKVKRPSGNPIHRYRWYNQTLPQILLEKKFDVLYAQSGIFSKAAKKVAGVFTTINNMLPFTPEMMAEYPLFSKQRLKFRILRRIYLKCVQQADAIVFHSNHALERIQSFGVNIKSKTFIALTGVPSNLDFNPNQLPPHPRGGKPFFFYLSLMHRYKNHLNLIRGYHLAYAELGDQLPDLILAGIRFDPPYVQTLLDEIKALKLESKIQYLEDPARNTIPGLIHHATANYFPSLCETNSVIQAEIVGMHGVMACSNIAPMPEVAGKAALFFDPYSPTDIGNSMIKIFKDVELQKTLRKASIQRASELKWDDCGRAIWKAAELAHLKFTKKS